MNHLIPRRHLLRLSLVAVIDALFLGWTNHVPLRARSSRIHNSQNSGAIEAPTTAFEVTSVKPSSPKDGNLNNLLVFSGGRLEARGCTLSYLVQEAYGVQSLQVVGAPKWAEDDRNSISAKPPNDSPLSTYIPSTPKAPLLPEERLMVQALLADRFRLAIHEKTKMEPGLAMELKKRSPYLIDAKDTNAFPVVEFGQTDNPDSPLYLQGINATMSQLAERLEELVGTPVVDETALQGRFDFHVEFAPDFDTDAPAPRLLGGIKELGLKLESKKVAVVHIIIDHVERLSDTD
jgi:uncharacterized protein (TIGR03435 family)